MVDWLKALWFNGELHQDSQAYLRHSVVFLAKMLNGIFLCLKVKQAVLKILVVSLIKTKTKQKISTGQKYFGFPDVDKLIASQSPLVQCLQCFPVSKKDKYRN